MPGRVHIDQLRTSDLPAVSSPERKPGRSDYGQAWIQTQTQGVGGAGLMTRSIFVPGNPVAQPRARFKCVSVNRKTIPVAWPDPAHDIHRWKQAIQAAWRDHELERFDGPVWVRLYFRFERPKLHHVTTDRQRPVKPKYRDAEHVSKPDVDNLAKGVLDALNGYAFKDDCQVTRLDISKDWATSCLPGVIIHIEELTEGQDI